MRVDVETSSPLTAGQTVCDVWGRSELPANVDVARRVSGPRFLSVICAPTSACPPPRTAGLCSYGSLAWKTMPAKVAGERRLES